MGFERHYGPKYFRDRAAEFRAKADNCEHPESRRKVAKTYDELARRAEMILTVRDAE